VLKGTSATDFATMLNALAQGGAFPYALPGEESISVIQTHAACFYTTRSAVAVGPGLRKLLLATLSAGGRSHNEQGKFGSAE
jgi:hypothetical protein